MEDGIYKTEEDGEVLYVTSLSFVQEPELEEGGSAAEISQYPLGGVGQLEGHGVGGDIGYTNEQGKVFCN